MNSDWKTNNVQAIFEKAGLYPAGMDSVLDVGCGLSLKCQYLDIGYRVGLDIHQPYLDMIEADVPYTTYCSDAMDIGKIYPDDYFDLVLLLDIIEHLEKKDALKLMGMAESIAKTAVIIETPQGWIPQNMDIWGHGGDEYQTHRSGCDKEDLEALGYTVLLRDYMMSGSRRHTDIEVDPRITLMDGIKCF